MVLLRAWSASRKRSGKLISRLNPQLAEDAREVTLDCPCGNEERLGDLAVGEALAGELDNAALAGRQRVEPGENDPARARTGGAELGLGVIGERFRACAVGGVEGLAEQLSRFGTSVAPPEHRPEVGKRASPLESGIAALEHLDRLTEQGHSTVTARHDAGGTQGHTECARCAEGPGQLKLLFCQAYRRFVIAESELGERGLRSPGEVARAGDDRSRQCLSPDVLVSFPLELEPRLCPALSISTGLGGNAPPHAERTSMLAGIPAGEEDPRPAGGGQRSGVAVPLDHAASFANCSSSASVAACVRASSCCLRSSSIVPRASAAA